MLTCFPISDRRVAEREIFEARSVDFEDGEKLERVEAVVKPCSAASRMKAPGRGFAPIICVDISAAGYLAYVIHAKSLIAL
jgi:hypothetical protein